MYIEYEVFSALDVIRCQGVIWRGLFRRTEGKGLKKRYFIRVNEKGIERIKQAYPKMNIKKFEE